MPQNFIESRRDQGFLLPPDVREWLPEDHLAWFVIDVVGRMDLSAFYGAYRADGHGRAAYEPSVMVALILFAFATNVQSSRAIERHCRQDVAYRVITGNLIPDHATIARFICRHEQALGELFSQVLGLCDEAGLVGSGVVAIDGTKLHANASRDSNVDYDGIAPWRSSRRRSPPMRRRMSVMAMRAGMSFRASCRPRRVGGSGWLAIWSRALRSASWKLGRMRQRKRRQPVMSSMPSGSWREYRAARGGCGKPSASLTRIGGVRPGPVPRSRSERLREAGRRLEQDLEAERLGNEAYQAYRAQGRMKDGRRFGGPPKPYQPPSTPQGEVNLTDPDARVMKAFRGYVRAGLQPAGGGQRAAHRPGR